MTIRGRKGRRAGLSTLTAIIVLACTASVAFAGTDHFFSGGLSPGRSYASGSAHSGVYYVRAQTNHTACVSVSQGWAGYSPPGSGIIRTTNSSCGVSPYAYPGQPSGFWHGWVGNPNSVTDVSVSDAHYSW